MAKIIISLGFGSGFPGEYEHRLDPLLIDCLEKLESFKFKPVLSTALNKAELHDLMMGRFCQLNIDISAQQARELSLVDIPSGTRFTIEEYDGSEYIISENDLQHVAP